MSKISETYQSKFISASELKPGENYIKTITAAEVEKLPGFQGKPDRIQVVITLNPVEGKPARMIALGKNQAIQIGDFLGDETDVWAGNEIRIGTAPVLVGAETKRTFVFSNPKQSAETQGSL
jgi:ribonucleotide monophosphatase NagD (HAD superfamily)